MITGLAWIALAGGYIYLGVRGIKRMDEITNKLLEKLNNKKGGKINE